MDQKWKILHINQMISEHAKEIKKKIEGGKLYGIPVDMENIDHVIVSAYLVAQSEYQDEVMKQRSIIETLYLAGR